MVSETPAIESDNTSGLSPIETFIPDDDEYPTFTFTQSKLKPIWTTIPFFSVGTDPRDQNQVSTI